MNELPWALEWLLAALLVMGGVFTLVGAIGLVRFPDFFMRLHAPTLALSLSLQPSNLSPLLLSPDVQSWANGCGVPPAEC